MPHKPKMKMPIEQRAKQFMPFSALKGLQEALEKKEHIFVSKPELSEEQYTHLNSQLHLLKKGDFVTVVYYSSGTYLKLTGIVANIDTLNQMLQIVTTEIPFDSILELYNASNITHISS